MLSACRDGYIDLVKYNFEISYKFIFNNINMSTKIYNEISCINIAIINGRVDIIIYLHKKGIIPDVEAIDCGIGNGYIEKIKFLLLGHIRFKDTVNNYIIMYHPSTLNLSCIWSHNVKLIYLAAVNGCLYILKYLYENKVDLINLEELICLMDITNKYEYSEVKKFLLLKYTEENDNKIKNKNRGCRVCCIC
jgi:ankyrin repeat protein